MLPLAGMASLNKSDMISRWRLLVQMERDNRLTLRLSLTRRVRSSCFDCPLVVRRSYGLDCIPRR